MVQVVAVVAVGPHMLALNHVLVVRPAEHGFGLDLRLAHDAAHRVEERHHPLRAAMRAAELVAPRKDPDHVLRQHLPQRRHIAPPVSVEEFVDEVKVGMGHSLGLLAANDTVGADLRVGARRRGRLAAGSDGQR
jgi:hypothetical protein